MKQVYQFGTKSHIKSSLSLFIKPLRNLFWKGPVIVREKLKFFPSIKGSLTRDFRLQIFSLISVPQAPKYSFGAFLNFFENSRRYSRINVYHRCQWHRWQAVQRCQQHRRKMYRQCRWHRWTIYISLVSLIPFRKKPKSLKFIAGVNDTTENCSPVSTTPLINFSAVSVTPAIRESCQY